MFQRSEKAGFRWSAPVGAILGALVVASLVAWCAPGAGAAAPEETCFGRQPTIVGTDGPDVLVGTDGPDVILAGGGNDKVEGMGGDDRLCGGEGDDFLSGGDGEDMLSGGPGGLAQCRV